MVRQEKEDRKKKPARQAFRESPSEPNKIGASTPYQFSGKNLTAYGGLLPVATMLEKLGFQALVEETITCNQGLRSEEHTSELQSRLHLVCRLLLEKKNNVHTLQPRTSQI